MDFIAKGWNALHLIDDDCSPGRGTRKLLEALGTGEEFGIGREIEQVEYERIGELLPCRRRFSRASRPEKQAALTCSREHSGEHVALITHKTAIELPF